MRASVETLPQRMYAKKDFTAIIKSISFAQIMEGFWFTTSLLLSIAMGPFAAIPAMMAIFSMASDKDGLREPEAAE